jgi:hypothetical protein
VVGDDFHCLWFLVCDLTHPLVVYGTVLS